MAEHNNRMREQQQDWPSPAFRNKIVSKFSKLEDEMKKNGTEMPKSSIEMEEYVFQRTGSREEYLDLVARVLISVSNDRRGQGQNQNPGAVPAQGSQDPIGALQNLTGQATSGMERQEANMEAGCDLDKLVVAVKTREALYSKDTINRALVIQEWKKVAKEVGTDVRTAKKKWTHLRDYFHKQHKYFSGSGARSSVKYKRKWYMYDTLSFLIPHLKDRMTIPRNMLDDASIDNKFDEVDMDYNYDRSDSGSDTAHQEDDPEDSADAKPLTKRPKYHSSNQPSSSTSNPELFNMGYKGEGGDDDLSFFKSLVPYMKKLDIITRMECQSEIHAVVLKYMKEASQHSNLDLEIPDI